MPVSRAPIANLFARVSTGTKMLFIMSGALLPLGVIQVLASTQAAHDRSLQHETDARLIATAEARQVDLTIVRGANIVRSATTIASADGARCRQMRDEAVRALGGDARVALFAADGEVRCATPGFAVGSLSPVRGGIGVEVHLLPAPDGLRLTVGANDGSYGVAELPPAMLARAMGIAGDSQAVLLRQGATRLPLVAARRFGPLDRRVTVTAPIGGGQLDLVATIHASAISVIEILLTLLPILMWAAAALIGWAVVDGLLLRPLGQLQRAVGERGARPFALPRLQTPAREISALADAFRDATEQIAAREAALEQGLDRQVRLTREVHHRVKNNLQVVASLIALHARGSSGEVASAYASIQRRVDALAVVHRNHFAELEENRGVALRSLIGEMTSNLRATAPAEASHFHLLLDVAPLHISQDVAVPVAFLLTEIVELLMHNAPADTVTIGVGRTGQPDRATLSIRAPGLAGGAAHGADRERFERIAGGLARQLRSALVLGEEGTLYTIEIIIVPDRPSDPDES